MKNEKKVKNNIKTLGKYKKYCGKKELDLIYAKANKLKNKHIVFISSTYQGGGVAEMLNSLIFLFNDIGIKVGWRILHGTVDFFTTTKKIHNALQGSKINLSQRKKHLYDETNRRFSIYTHINNDMVVVHDPQPLPLINFYKKTKPWIFRCHIDTSQSNPEVWSYLKDYINKYDRIIVSKDEYKRDLQIPSTVIRPAIDPLSTKNRDVTEKTIQETLTKHGISTEKPVIAQISRFDKWKDPLGVIKVFESVRKKVNCTLVLLGSMATDDPEGSIIYKKTLKKVEKSKFKNDIKIILVNSDLLVNCLQRKASVVIQKSTKEGFGLVVAEALYKGTPVVASNVGGIPFQVIDGFNGYLVNPFNIQGFADKIILLLKNDDLRNELGKNGISHIKSNFLITRLLSDWLNIFEQSLLKEK
jgi:trehalose synthase